MKKSKLITKYIELLPNLEYEDSMFYRGQSDSSWQLSSTAYRRLSINRTPNFIDQKIFIEYNKDLIERAKLYGYKKKDFRDLKDLELLAEIQHFEGATCLIDFTKSFLVALWFASTIPVINGEEKNTDGKIFILQSKKYIEKFLKIRSSDIEKDIDEILKFETRMEEVSSKSVVVGSKAKNYKYWIWEPEGMNNRILQQDSIFIFGKPFLDNDDYFEIIVRMEDKKPLQNELMTYFNINSDTLFKDLQGFASKVNSVNNSWFSNDQEDTKRISRIIFRRGETFYYDNDFEKALEQINDAIKLNPLDEEFYVLRGKTLLEFGKFNESIQDFQTATALNKESAINWDTYYLLGAAYLNLGELDLAEKSLNKSLELIPDNYYSIIGLGNIQLLKGEYVKSIETFNNSLKHANPESIGLLHALIAQSEAKLGNYEKMIQEYKLAFSNDFNEIGISLNSLEATIIAENKTAFIKFRDVIKKNSHKNIYPFIFKVLNSIGDLIFFDQPLNITSILESVSNEIKSSPDKIDWSLTELKQWLTITDTLSSNNKQNIYNLIEEIEMISSKNNKKIVGS